MAPTDNLIRAFGVDHVVRLTGLSKGQLRYWDKTGFFQPEYAHENRRSPYSRVYSFRNVVELRTLAVLRKEHDISLQHLREVARELVELGEMLWAETTLYVLGKEVVFDEPGSGRKRSVVSGQYVSIPLIQIRDDVSAAVDKLRRRAAESKGKVERHRHIARNSWVVAGTRIPTGAIIQFKEAGYTYAQIRREYPALTNADIVAALRHEEAFAERA